MRNPARAVLVTLFAIAFAISASRAARADETIRQVGDHPNYTFEIEPHLDLAWLGYDFYAAGAEVGLGLGARATIIIVQNGFIPTINNTVGIGFGGDLFYFGGGCAGNACPGLWSLYFPVVMQWNFYVAQRFSVFGEPGLSLNYAFFDNNACGRGVCGANFFPEPVLEVGGRYHINQHLALTGRIGYPALTFGVSFM
jgi:hypothetical protein